MHKVFISYHHKNDQWYKDQLVALGRRNATFINRSVETGDVTNDLGAQRIRKIIRDKWLRDSTVTIVLVGKDTAKRKHVDWEIYSSMYDGKKNKKSGVLVVTLPTIENHRLCTRHGSKEKEFYPDANWMPQGCRKDYEQACPSMPDRIVDNLVKPGALISVTSWQHIDQNPGFLHALIDLAFRDRAECEYDLSRSMKGNNS